VDLQFFENLNRLLTGDFETFFTVCRSPLVRGWPVARPLHTQDSTTQTTTNSHVSNGIWTHDRSIQPFLRKKSMAGNGKQSRCAYANEIVVLAEDLDVFKLRTVLILVGRWSHQAVCHLRKELWADGWLGGETRRVEIALTEGLCDSRGIILAEGLHDWGKCVVPLLNFTWHLPCKWNLLWKMCLYNPSRECWHRAPGGGFRSSVWAPPYSRTVRLFVSSRYCDTDRYTGDLWGRESCLPPPARTWNTEMCFIKSIQHIVLYSEMLLWRQDIWL
jgi:hypothetical protein